MSAPSEPRRKGRPRVGHACSGGQGEERGMPQSGREGTGSVTRNEVSVAGCPLGPLAEGSSCTAEWLLSLDP